MSAFFVLSHDNPLPSSAIQSLVIFIALHIPTVRESPTYKTFLVPSLLSPLVPPVPPPDAPSPPLSEVLPPEPEELLSSLCPFRLEKPLSLFTVPPDDGLSSLLLLIVLFI